jgi:hypothetical protein
MPNPGIDFPMLAEEQNARSDLGQRGCGEQAYGLPWEVPTPSLPALMIFMLTNGASKGDAKGSALLARTAKTHPDPVSAPRPWRWWFLGSRQDELRRGSTRAAGADITGPARRLPPFSFGEDNGIHFPIPRLLLHSAFGFLPCDRRGSRWFAGACQSREGAAKSWG